MTPTPALSLRLADGNAEAVRRNQQQQLDELKALVAADLLVINDITLPNATEVVVPHRLGRKPRMLFLSAIRNAGTGALTPGFIAHIHVRGNGEPIDETKVFVLAAFNWTGTVIVDAAVL